MRTITCTNKPIQVFTGSTTPALCTTQHAITNSCSFPLVHCQPIDRHIGQRHIRSFKGPSTAQFRNRYRTQHHASVTTRTPSQRIALSLPLVTKAIVTTNRALQPLFLKKPNKPDSFNMSQLTTNLPTRVPRLNSYIQ